MTREDNPYHSFIEVFGGAGGGGSDSPYLVGTIKSVAPLVVKTEEVEIGREDILINEMLLAGHHRRLCMDTTGVTGETAARGEGGNRYEAFSSHTHGMDTLGIPDGTFTTLDDFAIGEQVLLLVRGDQQQFILLCKLG